MSLDDLDHDELMELSATVLREVLDYIAGPNGAHSNAPAAFRRCMAMMWVLRPDLVGDLSMADLAARLAITRSAMSKTIGDFSDKFSFRSDRQRLPSVRENCRSAQLKRQKLPSMGPSKESFSNPPDTQVPQSCEQNE